LSYSLIVGKQDSMSKQYWRTLILLYCWYRYQRVILTK